MEAISGLWSCENATQNANKVDSVEGFMNAVNV